MFSICAGLSVTTFVGCLTKALPTVDDAPAIQKITADARGIIIVHTGQLVITHGTDLIVFTLEEGPSVTNTTVVELAAGIYDYTADGEPGTIEVPDAVVQGYTIKPEYTGQITSVTDNGDGTSSVIITGPSAGTYQTETGPLEAGERTWLVPSSVEGTGPWTQGDDGIYIQRTDASDAFARMAI